MDFYTAVKKDVSAVVGVAVTCRDFHKTLLNRKMKMNSYISVFLKPIYVFVHMFV